MAPHKRFELISPHLGCGVLTTKLTGHKIVGSFSVWGVILPKIPRKHSSLQTDLPFIAGLRPKRQSLFAATVSAYKSTSY